MCINTAGIPTNTETIRKHLPTTGKEVNGRTPGGGYGTGYGRTGGGTDVSVGGGKKLAAELVGGLKHKTCLIKLHILKVYN